MTTELNLGGKTFSVWLIIAFVAGIVAFITLFLNWETMVLSEGGESAEITATGLDLLTNKAGLPEIMQGLEEYIQYSFLGKLPLIIAILGIVGAVVAVLPTFIEKKKELSIALDVIFVVAIILCVVFFVSGLSVDLLQGEAHDAFKDLIDAGGDIKFNAGVGLIIALIASIVGLVGSALSTKENFF